MLFIRNTLIMKKIAILASGTGTNAEAIMNYFEQKNSAQVALILSNRKSAYVLQRAVNHGVPAIAFNKSELYDSPEKFVELLQSHNINLIVLAGFMCFVPDLITHRWSGRIVNIHPALLPKFGGQGMYGDNVHRAVVEAGETESGITIHYVNDKYDDGDIIFQASCSLSPTDTPQDVAMKVQQLEQEHFPRIIESIL